MRGKKLTFNELPASVRYALSLVVFSWFFFIISASAYTGQISLLHITMGTLICFAVFSLRNWARILTVIYDTFMAVMIGVELYYLIKNGSLTPLMPLITKSVSILLFTVSTIFLIMPGTARFYRELSGK